MADTIKTIKGKTTVGVDDYTFFPVTTDDSTGITYGTGTHLAGTVEISPTDNGGAEVFDADNGAYETETYLEKVGHELTNADIPPAVDAMWRGETIENGMITVGDAKTVYFGVAWRITKSDGTCRYVKYFKGSYSFASNVGGKTKKSTGAPDKQTAKATFTAVKRAIGGYYAYVDASDLSTADAADIQEKWFSDMNWKPASAAVTTG